MNRNCSTTPGRCQLAQHPDRNDELFCTNCKKRFHVTEDTRQLSQSSSPQFSSASQEDSPSFGPMAFAILLAVVMVFGLNGGPINLPQQPDPSPSSAGFDLPVG